MQRPFADDAPHPPIISGAGELMLRYRAVLCDVWGVVHNGVRPYESACDALLRFREHGGTVVLITNAPVPEDRVAAMLRERRVPRESWDAIVSSGAMALAEVARRGLTRLVQIGPRDRDIALFRELPRPSVSIEEAEALMCTGLEDDRNETAETYRPLLERALARKLPFICANPDLVVDVGGTLYLCAGAIADLYEHMGGEVYWCGKPHARTYDTARHVAETLRGAPIAKGEMLAIGDSLRTDLKGAERAGIDALFIASGIHRDELMGDGLLHGGRIAELFPPGSPPAIAAMPVLAW